MTRQDLLDKICQMMDELEAQGGWFNSVIIDFYADGELVYSGIVKVTT